MSVLRAHDLAVTPPGGSVPVVRDCSLCVERGSFLAIAGRNGGGKTSLALALAGLWYTSGGRLELFGAPFGPRAAPEQRRRVAAVLQDPSAQILQPTVQDELTFAGRNLGQSGDEIEARARRWSRAFDLEAEAARDPASLSAGRQQLVVLAAALCSGPDLLIADEPTAHMDAATRRAVHRALAEERRAGLAIVWVTQDPDELEAADRVLRLDPLDAAPAPPYVASRDPAPIALRVRMRPDRSESGPRVAVGEPSAIEIPRRGIVALTGANASGKTVLLSVAAGLLALDSVRVDWALAPEFPPIMALQFPELQVFEERVQDEVVFAAVARGEPRSRATAAAAQAFESLDLEPRRFMDGRTWSLSTGEKRLIEVVGALIAPASLVLLDEPTAGLDPARRAALGVLVRARAERDPVMIASQDIDWVRGLGASEHRLGQRDTDLDRQDLPAV